MNKEQALQYLAQLAQDFINTLPLSARNATTQMANIAINELKKSTESNGVKVDEVLK